MDILRQQLGDIRELEAEVLFRNNDGSSTDDESPAVGNPKQLIFQVLRCLRGSPDAASLKKAKGWYEQLAASLHCHPDSQQLEPLRTYLHLKLWDGDPAMRKELQSYLIRQLGINFDALAEDEPKPSAAGSSGSATTGLPSLPTRVTPTSYSSTEVLSTYKSQLEHDNWPLERYLAPEQLLPALLDAQRWPVEARWRLLCSCQVPVAAIPVAGLTALLQELLRSAAAAQQSGDRAVEMVAALRQAVEAWADGQWSEMTAEQVRAVHELLLQQPLAAGGAPSANRNALAALAFKALVAAPAVATAAAGVSPHQAEQEVLQQQLQVLLDLCGELGQPADWIRVQVVRAQLVQAASKASIPLQLLASYLQLLARCQWSGYPSPQLQPGIPAPPYIGGSGPWPGVRAGAAGGSRGPQVHPAHVHCQVCGQHPIVGVRLRSKRQLGVSVCSGCAGKQAAQEAAPYEEVAEDDTIYLHPRPQLPGLLGSLPSSEHQAWQEAAKVLAAAAAADEGGRFTPTANPLVEDYGVAVDQNLYWRTVAAAKLTSLADPASLDPWAQLYAAWQGDLSTLRAETELAFAEGNPQQYGVEEDVVLQLVAKNVGPQGIVVKLYHLNAWGYYVAEGKEVGVDLALEGVGPTSEQHIPLPDNALRRHQLHCSLGLAGQAGVVLVDVVAGARSCRCLLHKGHLGVTSRGTAAGQQVTVLYPNRSPAQGARVWCDGKLYTADAISGTILLPYVRTTTTTSLVIAAPPPTAAAGAGGEIVTFIPQYKRLAEHYKLAVSISCPHEALVPRTTAQLLLQLGLALHGETAPLQLLEKLSLQLTTNTADGTQVQQVVEELDLGPNPYRGETRLPLALPERVTQVTAVLRCRVKLVAPGINGEPELQNFEHTQSWQVNSMDFTRTIWDMVLTRALDTSSSSSSSVAASGSSFSPFGSAFTGIFKRGDAPAASSAQETDGGSYVLRVVGKAGEVPAVPATVQIDMYHAHWSADKGLRFKLQTDSQGEIHLGSLAGVRCLKAQFVAPPGSAAAGDAPALEAGSAEQLLLQQQEALYDDASTAQREWNLLDTAATDPLQRVYNVPQGAVLELPYSPKQPTTTQPLLLQLAPPTSEQAAVGHASSLEAAQEEVLQRLPVVADVTASHLQVQGQGVCSTLRLENLPVGYYVLLLPGAGGSGIPGMAQTFIVVMPAAPAAPAGPSAGQEADAAMQLLQWQLPGGGAASQVLIVPSSQLQALSISDASCSAAEGFRIQLRGSQEQLASAQVAAVFVRYLPDSTMQAAVQHAAAAQQQGSPEGYQGPAPGYSHPLLPSGSSSSCSYTDSARVDSAVAYVLQRRQWRAQHRLRAGMLLERPSLLVHPHKVRNVAAATTVLRGGDGEVHKLKMKKMAALPKCQAFGAAQYGSPGQYMAEACMDQFCSMAAPGGGGFGGAYGGRAATRRAVTPAQPPSLSYLQPSGLLLSGLLVDPATGQVEVKPEQLQQLLGGVELGASGYTMVYLQVVDGSQEAPPLGAVPAASCRLAVQPAGAAAGGAGVRDLGLVRPLVDQGICAQVLRVVALGQPGSQLVVSNAGAASLNIYYALPKVVKLMALLLERPHVLQPPPVPMTRVLQGVSEPGSAADLWQSQWAEPLSRWPCMAPKEQQEACSRLASCEWSLFLAAKDPAGFTKLVLPLLRLKLPASLTFLEGLLLLQVAHRQPLLPHPAASAAVAATPEYARAKAAFLAHWLAPRRYQKLNACEQVLLAALEGAAACAQLAADLKQQLAAQAAASQGRDIRKGPPLPITWLHPERRWQFDLALACGQADTDQSNASEQNEEDEDAASDGTATDGFEMVGHQEAMMYEGGMVGGLPPPPAPAAAPCPMPMAAAAPGVAPMAAMARMRTAAAAPAMQAQQVMAAREAAAADAAKRAHLAPKEVCEWCEVGWWRYNGGHPPQDLIPVSHFWAEYAAHLATAPSADSPFLPEHLTSAAASTAAAVCALAVLGLPFSAAAGASGADRASRVVAGCDRSYQGASLTLTVATPCLVYLKSIEQVAEGDSSSSRTSGGGATGSGGGASSSMLVVQQLFDPQDVWSTDANTGEVSVKYLDPAQHQLLAGRAYGLCCVVTNTSSSEQQLELLLQVPQGALPLEGTPAVQPLPLTLTPYSSHRQDLFFYFPSPGSFPLVQPSLTKRGKPAWLPPGPPLPLVVVWHAEAGAPAAAVSAGFDWSSFQRRASNQQLLEWLQDGDLNLVELSDIQGRCKDKSFFTKLVELLAARHVYEDSILQWSIYHFEESALSQYLPNCRLVTRLGVPLVTPLVSLLPGDVGHQHLEYWPWVNPYSRPLPGTAQPDIPSVLQDIQAIRTQYQTFLLDLLLRPQQQLDLLQAVAAATYLLLQDRVDDAEQVLGPHLSAVMGQEVEGGAADTPAAMQVAYLGAWLALSPRLPWTPEQQQHGLQVAQHTVARYADCTEPGWAKRWAALSAMLEDITTISNTSPAAAATSTTSSSSRAPAADSLDLAAEPLLTVLGLQGGLLKLKARNLDSIKVSAYEVDVELLFTRQPFGGLLAASSTTSSTSSSQGRGLGSLAYIQPRAAAVLQLVQAGLTQGPQLPAGVQLVADPAAAAAAAGGAGGELQLEVDVLFPQLKASAVLLELQAGNIRRYVPRTSSRLVAHALEGLGQVQVLAPVAAAGSSGGAQLVPAPGAYVKVFAKDPRTGEDGFHKDGYTDLRGRFDYHTLTSAGSGGSSKQLRYSLLVVVDGEGSLVLEAMAPARS